MRLPAILFLSLGLLTAPSWALTKDSQEPAATRTIEGAVEFRLENGLTIVVLPDPSRTDFTFVEQYRVGFADDPRGRIGLAHLMEHINGIQTKNHPHLFEEISMRGQSCSARTDFEFTRYCVTMPHSGDNLAWAINVAVERIGYPDYSVARIDHELPVVTQEEAIQHDDPFLALIYAAGAMSFAQHAYATGMTQYLSGVTPEELLRHHHRYYRPDNLILVISGPLEPKKVAALVSAAYAAIPGSREPLPQRVDRPPPQAGRRKELRLASSWEGKCHNVHVSGSCPIASR